MTTADLLTATETCTRKGYWARHWQRQRLDGTEFLRRAVAAGLTEATREDFGEVAGETVMELAVEPGMEMPSSRDIHQSVVHHAALADVLTTAIRKRGSPAWGKPLPQSVGDHHWASSAFLDPSGERLRRVVLATSWSDERHYAALRSWHALGEVAIYGLPMTVVVCVLGQNRDGRRTGPWTRGFLHPKNHVLRFRKRQASTYESFSDSWEHVWREDRGEIPTSKWLQAMMDDDILRDVCFTMDLEVPGPAEQSKVRQMARAKLDRITRATKVPEAAMSVCDRPPCPFKACCWGKGETVPSESRGFVTLAP